jgi:hypothetical protein
MYEKAFKQQCQGYQRLVKRVSLAIPYKAIRSVQDMYALV